MMRAAIAIEKGVVRCEEVSIPVPADDHVLVRTMAASICGSDLHMVNTGWSMHAFPAMPGHPGHEAVGEVIESKSEKFSVGDIVLTTPHIWHSRCFAEYQAVDDAHVLKLSSDVDVDTITLSQQLGTVVYAAKRLPASLQGQSCVVIGQGSAGLFWDFQLKLLGAEKVFSIEPLSWRRDLGLRYGVDQAIDVTGDDAIDAVNDMTGGIGVDLVVEAVGSTETLSQAFHVVRDQGRVVLFGLPESENPVPFDYSQMFKSRANAFTVLGSQDEVGLKSYAESVRLISQGQIDVKPIISHRVNIADIDWAFQLASERVDGVVKIGVTFD
ncbi:MAG: zinc-binding dehydrogenase [SAR202 cluster bacterium]|nr:zinc-binding dehydrogenase [SAR202 cluster bacterium]|tara:strand:+ start:14408 stop:15385 length:978 start_codon:yes stop_codon:yes gene_type:complete